MGKRGPKPKKVVDETWRPELAYAIGLLASDGYLSSDGLLIDLTSNDIEQLRNFSKCLGCKFNIGKKWNLSKNKSYRIQFKNRLFYDFLLRVGLFPRKSLLMDKLSIPNDFFFDFVRGLFDGDGCSYSYWDKRWRSSFMFYMSFASGSKKFIYWLQIKIKENIGISGHIGVSNRKNPYYQLKYSKNEAIMLAKEIYKNKNSICLKRKKLKIIETLAIIDKQRNNILTK